MNGVAVRTDPVEPPVITLQLAAFADALVVTATRMEEPLREVPLSISVATGADIERQRIGNLKELSRSVEGDSHVLARSSSTWGASFWNW